MIKTTHHTALYLLIILFFVVAPFVSAQNQEPVFSVNHLDLVWEGETYTPPLYSGRSYISTGSTARVIAFTQVIKDGNILPNNEVVYRWLFNGRAISEQSGPGKNTFEFLSSPRTNTITLEIIGDRTEPLGTKTLTVRKTSPEIMFFKNDPLLGTLFNTNLSDRLVLKDDEITLNVYSFFTSPDRTSNLLTYTWFLGNKKIGGNNSPSITLRTPGSNGKTQIKALVENTNDIFQNANKTLKIEFGNI